MSMNARTQMTELQNSSHADEVLHALADEQRRIVLRELSRSDEPGIPVEPLVAQIALQAGDVPNSREEIRIQLQHVHLPLLEDAGLCSCDATDDRVTYHPDGFTESLLAFLE